MLYKNKIIPLDHRIYLLDGYDMNLPGRTGSYVIFEDDLTIVETGPSPSIKYIKSSLEELGYSLQQVKNIIVTHIHLDHSGGAGLLMQQCPNAKIYVHPRGARHLQDPRKLAGAARAIYGESFSDFFDPIIPIPEDKIIIKNEGDTLKIGSDCILEFFETPGHSRHHLSIYDPVSNGMFTGDTAGVRYQQLTDGGIDFYLPTTTPNHFDPHAMKTSIQRFKDKKLERIYFGHFGMTQKPINALNEVSRWLDIFMEEAEHVYYGEKQGYDRLSERLLNRVISELARLGVPEDHQVYTIIQLDLQICSLGIIEYLQKLAR